MFDIFSDLRIPSGGGRGISAKIFGISQDLGFQPAGIENEIEFNIIYFGTIWQKIYFGKFRGGEGIQVGSEKNTKRAPK